MQIRKRIGTLTGARRSVIAALVAASGLVAIAGLSHAQDSSAPAGIATLSQADPQVDGLRRPLTSLEARYAREHPAHPSLDAMMDTSITLGQLADGYTAPREGVPSLTMRLGDIGGSGGIYDAALPLISQAFASRARAFGLLGTYAEPDPSQVRLEDGVVVDARPAGSTSLTYVLTTGRVSQVRTQALGERVDPDKTLNNPVHARIRANSPVRPEAGGQNELLVTDPIDDYVERLNRHPGRRVDVSVAATGEEPGAVAVDYLITENRPWLLYAQAKRDGNRGSDEWRYRFGFIHNQLTNADDILSLDYSTSFDNVRSVNGSYERPLAGSQRWRWRVYGSWYEYTAADVGLPDASFEGDGWSAGGEVIWNFYQKRDLFLDAIAGMRYDQIGIQNTLAGLDADDSFVIGYVGARLAQQRESFRTNAQATLEFSLDGASDEAQQQLGRTNADENFVLVRASGEHAFYVEPLLDPSLDRFSGFAHEIALRAGGQFTFGQRLIPNYEDVLGGIYSVRGYPEAIVAGDHSLVVSAEYRLHIPALLGSQVEPGSFFGQPFRWKPQYEYGPTDWDLIARAFVDAGWVGNQDRESFEKDQTLLGAGVGLELALTRHFNLRADLGVALKELENADGSTLVEQGDVQLHFVGTLVY
jgi:hemolysin activation/secretion protein